MKKFRILGILAILVIVGDFAISFTAGWQPYTRLKVSLWRYDLWKQQYWIHCVIVK